MDIEYTAELPAKPETVLDTMTSESFLEAYGRELEVKRYSASVSHSDQGPTIHTTMTSSTEDVPAPFRSFVGDEVEIRDTRAWRRAGSDTFRADLSVNAAAKKRRASITGTMGLSPTTSGSTLFTVHADVDVQVPVVGKLAKGAVAELGREILEETATMLQKWLGHPTQGP